MTDKFKSIAVIIVGFQVISFFVDTPWPLYVATTVGVGALLSDKIADGILWLWFGIAKVLGAINSRILLSVVYLIFLFPIALISRLAKGTALQLKRSEASYYTERNHQYKKEDFENPW